MASFWRRLARWWVRGKPSVEAKDALLVLKEAWLNAVTAEPHHFYEVRTFSVLVGNVDAYMLLLEHATVCLDQDIAFPVITLFPTPVKLQRFYEKKSGYLHDVGEVRLRFIDRVVHFLDAYYERETSSTKTLITHHNLRQLRGVVGNLETLVKDFS